MLAYAAGDGCRLTYLRRALDDPELAGVPDERARCGRCDACGGLSLPTGTDEQEVTAARSRLERPGVPVVPRRMWPTAMTNLGLPLRGKIPPAEQAAAGRAVARLTDLGWGNDLRQLFAPGSDDQQVPVPLRHALKSVLDAWAADGWPDGAPQGVVAVESLSHPTLAGHVAAGAARILDLPVLTRFDLTDAPAPTGAGAVNSAQRLAAVAGRYRLADPEAIAGRAVLLADDRIVTGWTLAICARSLRQAGATAVYPLALASDT
jgi:ATP-dependent DNA helicase RecQ